VPPSTGGRCPSSRRRSRLLPLLRARDFAVWIFLQFAVAGLAARWFGRPRLVPGELLPSYWLQRVPAPALVLLALSPPTVFSTAFPSPCLHWPVMDWHPRLGRKPCLASTRPTMDLPTGGIVASSNHLGLPGEDLTCPFAGGRMMASSSPLPSWRHRLAKPPLRSTLLQVVWETVMCGSPRYSSVQVQGYPWWPLRCTLLCFLAVI
jgi:hypothetical protein